MISSVAPISLYLRIPSENTRKSVELSELQAPASGLGIDIFGFEDRRDDVRLREVAAGSSKCSVVATASVVIVGGGFGVGRKSNGTSRQVTVECFDASHHVLRGSLATGKSRIEGVCH